MIQPLSAPFANTPWIRTKPLFDAPENPCFFLITRANSASEGIGDYMVDRSTGDQYLAIFPGKKTVVLEVLNKERILPIPILSSCSLFTIGILRHW